jgi:hypothetical protein
VPVRAPQDIGGLLPQLGDLRLGGEQDPLLDVAALAVQAVELLGDRLGTRRVLGQQELQARVRALQPARGVDPRRQAEADRARVQRARVGLCDAQQRAQPRPPCAGERRQPGAHEPAVLAAQRDAVGDGRQRDEVEVLVGARRVRPRGLEQRGRQLVGDAGRAEVGTRVAAERRMDQRRAGQRAVGARGVMVGDDDVEAGRPGPRDLLDGGHAAVHGQQQPGAARGQPVDGGRAEAVAVLRPAREVPVHGGAEVAQHADEDRRRGDAVDVVVAVDRDPRAGADVAQDDLDSLGHPGEGGRVVAVLRVEERGRRGGIGEPAADQDLGEHVRDAEVALQRGDVAHRARRDVETRLHGCRRLSRGSDGDRRSGRSLRRTRARRRRSARASLNARRAPADPQMAASATSDVVDPANPAAEAMPRGGVQGCARASPARRERPVGGPARSGSGSGGALLAQAEPVHERDAEHRAGDRLDRGQQRRVVATGDREAVDDDAEEHAAEHRAEERADDAAPLAVGEEDREVPDGEGHHDPGENRHG